MQYSEYSGFPDVKSIYERIISGSDSNDGGRFSIHADRPDQDDNSPDFV